MKTIEELSMFLANADKQNMYFDSENVLFLFVKDLLSKDIEVPLVTRYEQLDIFNINHVYYETTGATKKVTTDKEYFKYSWAHVFDPDKNLVTPIWKNIEAMKAFFDAGNNVYIITCYSSNEEIQDKLKLYSKYCPWLNKDKIIFVPAGQDKSNYTRGNRGILFDDWSKNCEQWEQKQGNVAVLMR